MSLATYNLADDIGEDNNLAGKMPERAKQMQQMLARWREDVNANMPKPNPDFDPVAKEEGK